MKRMTFFARAGMAEWPRNCEYSPGHWLIGQEGRYPTGRTLPDGIEVVGVAEAEDGSAEYNEYPGQWDWCPLLPRMSYADACSRIAKMAVAPPCRYEKGSVLWTTHKVSDLPGWAWVPRRDWGE